jgi:MtrB/PioB family decaheme-associated outer membrane protein
MTMICLSRRAGRSRPTLLALALLAAFAPAAAHADSKFEASVDVGLGAISGNRDNRLLFDQYSGFEPGQNVFGVFGASYWRLNDATGIGTRFTASDLLNGNRELSLRYGRQGDWRITADYGELVRRETVGFNSGITGVGTPTPTVNTINPGTGSDLDLHTKRSGLGLGFQKIITPRLQLDVSARTEHKEGARLWGIGFACPSALAVTCTGTTGIQVGSGVLFVPEPIDSDHHQVEARLGYAFDKLRLSLGYYGSFYQNAYGSMTVGMPGTLLNPVGVSQPISTGLAAILGQPFALPPDNQAHQFDLTGNYLYSTTTQFNFKLAHSRWTQSQDFAAAGFTLGPAGVPNLGGKIKTTLAQLGFSTRPLAKLSVSGTLNYQDRDDETPVALYNLEGTSTYTNRQLPYKTVRGKLQASYQFTPNWRGSLGGGYETIDRGVFTPTAATSGITALRQKTDETSIRGELRRRMGADFSGAVSLEHSERRGSNWLKDNSGLGVTEITDPNAPGVGFDRGIFMPNLADRNRDKVRLLADWQPSEKLSTQFAIDIGNDHYSAPGIYGVRRSDMRQFSVDASYAFNDRWSATGFVSYGTQDLDQGRPGASFIAFRDHETMVGLGVTGKANAKLQVGANLSLLHDRSTYLQTLDATASAANATLLQATGGLPPITFRQQVLSVNGNYALNKNASVRADLAYYHTRWDDWAWGYNGQPFFYSDGTIGTRNTTQSITLLRVVYTYRWQ